MWKITTFSYKRWFKRGCEVFNQFFLRKKRKGHPTGGWRIDRWPSLTNAIDLFQFNKRNRLNWMHCTYFPSQCDYLLAIEVFTSSKFLDYRRIAFGCRRKTGENFYPNIKDKVKICTYHHNAQPVRPALPYTHYLPSPTLWMTNDFSLTKTESPGH